MKSIVKWHPCSDSLLKEENSSGGRFSAQVHFLWAQLNFLRITRAVTMGVCDSVVRRKTNESEGNVQNTVEQGQSKKLDNDVNKQRRENGLPQSK